MPPEINTEPRTSAAKLSSRAPALITIAAAIVVVGAVVGAGVAMERREQHAARAIASANPGGASASSASPRTPERAVPPEAVAAEAIARSCPDANDCACRARAVAELLTIAAADAALAALDAAPSACRAHAEAESLRAEALARAGSPEATAFARRRALEHASDGRAAYALARLAHRDGQQEAAKAAAERAATLGREAPALVLLGRLALDAGDAQKALDHFTRASTLEPKEVEARYFAALALRRTGKYQKARSLLLGAARENPRFVEARIELASMAHSIGAMDDARHHYRKLLEVLAESDPRAVELGTKLGERKDGATYTVEESRR